MQAAGPVVMAPCSLLAAAAAVMAIVPVSTSAAIVVKNQHLSLSFGQGVSGQPDSSISLMHVGATPASPNLIADPAASSQLWQLDLLTPDDGIQPCLSDSPGGAASIVLDQFTNSVALKWRKLCFGSDFMVTMDVRLRKNAHAASISLQVRQCSGDSDPQCHMRLDAGSGRSSSSGPSPSLWATTVTIAGIVARADDSVFYPLGYGELYRAASVPTTGKRGDYPGSSCTMQFMAAGGGKASANDGLYFAAHDPDAHAKSLYVFAVPGSNATERAAAGMARSGTGVATYEPSVPVASSEHAGGSCSATGHAPTPVAGTVAFGAAATQVMSVSTLREGAGTALNNSLYTLPFTFALGVTSAGGSAADSSSSGRAPFWFGASQLYKSWAVANASWTQAGPIRERTADFPDWYLLWLQQSQSVLSE